MLLSNRLFICVWFGYLMLVVFVRFVSCGVLLTLYVCFSCFAGLLAYLQWWFAWQCLLTWFGGG